MKRSALICALAVLLLLGACAGSVVVQPSGQVDNPASSTAPPSASPDAAAGETQDIEFIHDYAGVRMTLPEGWEYETIVSESSMEDGGQVGVNFWPEERSDFSLSLLCQKSQIGICGTGVDFEDVSFGSGLCATKCTEEISGGLWLMLIFKDVPGGFYSLDGYASREVWEEYRDDIEQILSSLQLGIQ